MKKIKLKWIVMFLLALIIFIASYVLISIVKIDVINRRNEEIVKYGIICACVFIINFLFFITFGIIIGFKSIKLTHVILIAKNKKNNINFYIVILMDILFVLILFFGLTWSFFIINEAILKDVSEYFSMWCSSVCVYAKVWFLHDNSYVSGFNTLNRSILPFVMYILIFVSIVFWNSLNIIYPTIDSKYSNIKNKLVL